MRTGWPMAVVPVHELFEDEEDEESGHQPDVDSESVPKLSYRVRDHVEDSAAEERAGRQRYERHHDALESGFRQEQRDATDKSDGAHGYTCDHYPAKRRHQCVLGRMNVARRKGGFGPQCTRVALTAPTRGRIGASAFARAVCLVTASAFVLVPNGTATLLRPDIGHPVVVSLSQSPNALTRCST